MVIAYVSINLPTVRAPSNNLLIISWGYQLQNADPSQIANTSFDLVVIDYSRDGSEAGEYTISEIELIKDSGVIPVAYISIGEAEDYRYYWNESWFTNPPSWLGHENPEWPGNYPVKYWDRDWQKIIFNYLDRIISQGFMGVYLDKIDSFEYWSDPNNGEGFHISEEEAAARMIDFVASIADYCRNRTGNPDFLVIPQNGENIIDYDQNGTYLEKISGIGVEDLWYNGLQPNPESYVQERIQYLDLIKEHDKIVLSVDYVDDGTGYVGENKERIDDYINKARSKGYIPYAAKSDRALDELNIIPGVQPLELISDGAENPLDDLTVYILATFTLIVTLLGTILIKLKLKQR